MPQSVNEYRKTIGNHISWADQKQAGQKQQNERIRQMAAQPGSHAGNRQRHDAIYAALQLISILSSVQNTSASPAITPGRADELATEARITRANNLDLKRRIERVANREFKRNAGQHSWTGNAPETQRGQSNFAFSNAQQEPIPEKSITFPVRSVETNAAYLSGNIIPEHPASAQDTKPTASWLTPDTIAESEDMARLIHATGHPLATRANAIPVPPASSASTQIASTASDNMRLIYDEQEKGDLIHALKSSFVQSGWLDIGDAEDFEFSLKTVSSGEPLVIIAMNNPPDGLQRTKRMAQSKIDESIVRHIAENCAVEEEVLNTNGENEGKILLYEAQRIDNPFRRIYDGHDGSPSPEARGVANGLNLGIDMLSLGIKPLITSIIANAKRSKYYQSRGDMVCAERYKHLSLATLATSLDIDGLAMAGKALPRNAKPSELQHALPADKNAAYFTRDPATGIRHEILLRIASDRNVIVDNSGNEIFLKPSGRKNEYLTHHPHAAKPEWLQRRVVVDEKTMRWRYADVFDNSELNIDIREGKPQISLHGEHYDLLRNADNKYEIVVRQSSGEVSLLPVYMEPLSRTWHLAAENSKPIFTSEQKALLERVSSTQNNEFYYIPTPSNNERYYGAGVIYRAEMKGDPSHYSQGIFIEMNGRLVPVKTRTTPGHGLHYEVVDPLQAGDVGFPITFDGARWRFEADSAPQASKEIKRLVTPGMFVSDIQSSRISAPDVHGLNWDMQDNAYLKVEGGYIRVVPLNENRFAIYQSDGRRIILRLRDGKFFEERLNERLQNLRTVGLNGHKRKTPEALLEECCMTPESARALLAQYDFPAPQGAKGIQSLYSEYDFARYVHEYESVPPWAERFKRPRVEPSHSPENGIVTVEDLNSPDNTLDLKLGAKLGEGYWGEVYVDADNPDYVIKRFNKFGDSYDEAELDIDETYTAPFEAEAFRRYYGEDSATAYVDKDDNVNYLRMLRVPGITLDKLPVNSLPPDAIERYVDMLGKLQDVGILHHDLSADNVLWDGERFNPIDMQNVRESYFSASAELKEEYRTLGDKIWERVIKEIDKRMRRATT